MLNIVAGSYFLLINFVAHCVRKSRHMINISSDFNHGYYRLYIFLLISNAPQLALSPEIQEDELFLMKKYEVYYHVDFFLDSVNKSLKIIIVSLLYEAVLGDITIQAVQKQLPVYFRIAVKVSKNLFLLQFFSKGRLWGDTTCINPGEAGFILALLSKHLLQWHGVCIHNHCTWGRSDQPRGIEWHAEPFCCSLQTIAFIQSIIQKAKRCIMLKI